MRLRKKKDSVPSFSDHTNQHTTMPLEIQILQNISSQNSGAVTVKLSGSLDTATAPELEREIEPVMGRCGKDLMFDLAGLKFISSAGLRVFSMVRKQLKERGGQASFIHMQPQIAEVFAIIQALPGVSVFASEAEFDSYLATRQKMVEDNP
jgi:anti-sigma B factor antagonist